MKKTLNLSTLLLLLIFPLAAQPGNKPLPQDPEVITGTLKNGLRYYIRHNSRPEKRVEFRLVVNAGSILEDDDQQGLAHFCEHMAFNGSKHFSKNQVVDFLEESGMRFGADLNAYTSFDETVYKFQIPSDRRGLLDSAFLILEDWAHNLTLDPEEIDKERGVIEEEWRLGLGAQDRMQKKYFPILFRGSRYAERLPIGKMEIIRNFPYDALRRFYHDWYRPDLQAVIVVGDIDPAYAKKMILKHFKKIRNPRPERPRKVYGLPDNDKPIIAVATDREATNNQVAIFWKHPKTHLVTYDDYRRSLMLSLISGMLNDRFFEITQKPDAPFLYAGCTYSGFLVRTRDAWQAFAIPKSNQIEKAFATLIRENIRAKRYGFTPGELKRQKAKILSNYENMLKEKDKTNSASYVDEYVRNYLEQEAFPGIEKEYELVSKMLPSITLTELNRMIDTLVTEKNTEILATGPARPDNHVPDTTTLRDLYVKTLSTPVEPYVDKTVSNDLNQGSLPGAAIVQTRKDTIFGYTEITLANGVTVVMKPTPFKNDQILMDSYSYGGSSLLPSEKAFMARVLPTVIQRCGVGEMSATDLKKMLAGKKVNVAPRIGMFTQGISGNSTKKDLETMLQLTYLYFTQPRRDEEAFQAFRSQLAEQVKYLRDNPQMVFVDTLYKLATHNDPRFYQIPTPAMIQSLDLDSMLAFYRDRFADADGFHFYFVGSFDPDELIPLVQKYLGSLPALHRQEMWKDVIPPFPEDITRAEVHKGIEPKSLVAIMMQGPYDWSLTNRILYQITNNILNIHLREVMREKESKTYGVGVDGSDNKLPRPRYTLVVSWGCSPDYVDRLIRTAFGEMKKMTEQPPSQEDLEKSKEKILRSLETDMKTNRYWLDKLMHASINGDPLVTYDEIRRTVENIRAEEVREAARRFFQLDHYLQVVLKPEEKK